MRVIIGSDHGGFALKTDLIGFIRELGHEVVDYGTHSIDPVDYPDIALLVASAVAADPERTLGIMVDGAGIGSAMTATRCPVSEQLPATTPSRPGTPASTMTPMS